ncbi:MAG: GAF domain-containing sensor histidine kinase [Ignavibacteriae bacterium]|nr:GAF domain-containing sensor histidine kinase [Ignavibacteriota bacterium]
MNLDELLRQNSFDDLTDGATATVTESRVRNFETILNIVRKINTSLILTDVLELVTDEAIRIAKAERGFLMLASEEGKLEFVVGRNTKGESIRAENFQISSSVLEDVFSTGESLCIENALSDERFERRQSIMNLELQTIICSPLHTHKEKIGVMYVDSKFIQAVDKEEILNIFEILTGQAAIAIANARLYENLKRAYEELKEANEHIIQSERMAMKGEVAAEVSHELKNLVGVVLLNLELMKQKSGKVSGDEINTLVEKTITGARKIEGFSKSLLTRRRAGSSLVLSSVNKIAADFAEFIKFLPKFKQNVVVATLAPDLPPVNLDIDQVQQVLLNLANNSVEACSTATIELRTEFDARNGRVLLHVQDNGPGINEAILDKLFTEKVTTKVDGHGYGLPICRQILEGHGGTISVRSKSGEGVRFTLSFPGAAKPNCQASINPQTDYRL